MKKARSKSPKPRSADAGSKAAGKASSPSKSSEVPSAIGHIISCDVPTKQFIQYLDELKPLDKKFILQDLDSTHLLVKLSAKDEITRKVNAWMDENVFSAVERVGEDLDMS